MPQMPADPSSPGENRPVPPKPVPPRPVRSPVPSGTGSRHGRLTSNGATPPLPQAESIPDEVVIRTMQDDIEALQAHPVRDMMPAASAGPNRTRSLTGPPAAHAPAASPAPAPAQPAVFPLPPRATGQRTKVIVAPPRHRRRRSFKGVIIGFSLLLLIGGGVSLAWYLGIFSRFGGAGSVPPAPAAAVLPGEALAIVQYRLASPQDRSEVLSLWSTQPAPASITSLLAGDPRLVVDDPELTELYYVVLERNSSPYLLMPQTAQATELLSQSSDIRALEIDGWYVLHSLVSDPYAAALAGGSLADIGSPAILQPDAAPAPLRLVLSQGLVPTLRKDIAGEQFKAGQLQEITVAGRRQNSNTLQVAGTAALLTPLDDALTNQQLLSLVPAPASLVRLGANFERDLSQWLSVAGVIDDQVLRRPLVQQLLTRLTAPYAYFVYPSLTGERSLGLIIELPPDLRGTLTLQDQALEEAMPALVPLILQRPQVAPVAFTEVAYAGVPLRYANLVGSTQALDYAVTPTHLLIATSRESMQALLDTVGSTQPALATGGAWQGLMAAWGALPAAHDMVFGTITTPALTQLLPAAGAAGGIPFGLVLQPGTPQASLQAVLQLTPASPVTAPPALAPAPRLRP